MPQGYKNYSSIVVGEQLPRLPVGGYICRIIKAEESTASWGDIITLSLDIAEGEHKGFYEKNYKAQQATLDASEKPKWKGIFKITIPTGEDSKKGKLTESMYKGALTSIENSNAGFRLDASKAWDVAILGGKFVGAIFHNKEWEMGGKTGFYTACYSLRSTETIRSGNYNIPADKLLAKDVGALQSYPMPPTPTDDSFPFA